jgi:hypothetical protein
MMPIAPVSCAPMPGFYQYPVWSNSIAKILLSALLTPIGAQGANLSSEDTMNAKH